MRSVIDHQNSKFSEVVSNDSEQNVDEHMVKFKGRSGMKLYIKSESKKWGFNYLYQIDIYLGRKKTPEFNLGLWEEVVLQLMKDLE